MSHHPSKIVWKKKLSQHSSGAACRNGDGGGQKASRGIWKWPKATKDSTFAR